LRVRGVWKSPSGVQGRSPSGLGAKWYGLFSLLIRLLRVINGDELNNFKYLVAPVIELHHVSSVIVLIVVMFYHCVCDNIVCRYCLECNQESSRRWLVSWNSCGRKQSS